MNMYAYIPTKDGIEPCGSENKFIIRDLKTIQGAINRLRKFPKWNSSAFVLQTYTRFYDETTFKTVYTHKP